MLGIVILNTLSSRPGSTLPTFLRIPRMVNLRRSALEHDFAAFGMRTLQRSLMAAFLRIPRTQPRVLDEQKIWYKFTNAVTGTLSS
jgi:hypothetical protein